ncbi:hypothetical protein Rhe02_64300 [Rhizocola hellebori]|uniref:Uncharacterized protein n=2 Tax=Rhizocola hellebori TaxID=1392758 RepID=A0A8J3QEW8_9ACTN|nr:hypothetical protein Rhe02_64300 [Rhizocola hellebori]
MGSLRAAVGILIISVILVGVSITLRRDSEGIKSELEDTMYDEIDTVRAEVRDDLGHAVQATQRALGEKMQYLMDQVESTRAELEATKAQLETLRHQPVAASHRAGAPAPGIAQHGQRQAMPPGVLRHTETVQVTTRHTIMDPHEDASRGTTYGTRQPIASRGAVQPHHDRDDYRDDYRERDRDQYRERDDYRERDREESWTEQRLREQLDRRRDANDSGAAVDRWQRDSHDDRWVGPVIDEEDDRRPAVRAGDRWASVRSDDHGRELRMGERRAGVYSDGRGTEVRIEDRWAAVRREAGLDRPRWDDDERLDAPRDFPYRDRDRERRAISASDRDDRWSDRSRDDRRHDDRERYR